MDWDFEDETDWVSEPVGERFDQESTSRHSSGKADRVFNIVIVTAFIEIRTVTLSVYSELTEPTSNEDTTYCSRHNAAYSIIQVDLPP